MAAATRDVPCENGTLRSKKLGAVCPNVGFTSCPITCEFDPGPWGCGGGAQYRTREPLRTDMSLFLVALSAAQNPLEGITSAKQLQRLNYEQV